MKTHNLVAYAASLAVLLPALAGCTTADGNQPILLTWQETMSDYDHETRLLQLPQGARWSPEDAEASLGSPDPKQLYEAGIGAQMAELEWYCAWAAVALHDKGMRSDAATQMRKLTSMSVWSHMDDNGHRLYESLNDSVTRGDVGPIPVYLNSFCHGAQE